MLDLYLNDYPVRKIQDHELKRGNSINDKTIDPVLKKVNLPDGCCIAGGSVTNYLLGRYNSTSDYDIFIWDNFNIQDILKCFGQINRYLRNANYIEIDCSIGKQKIKVQIILSKYNSLEQILKSFDLWASQVAYYKGNFYGTEQGIWAIENKKQPFDYRKANTSYISRIDKYINNKDIKCFTINGKREVLNWDKVHKFYNPESQFWELDISHSGYESNKSHAKDNTNKYFIYRANIKYLMGKGSNYYVTEEGKPLDIGSLKDILCNGGCSKEYSRLYNFIDHKQVQILSDLGDDLRDILDNYEKLKANPVIIPLEFQEKVRQFKGISFDESILYKEYTPVWVSSKLYPKTSWNYRYTIFLLFEMGWLPQDIRNMIILKWSCMNIQEIDLFN